MKRWLKIVIVVWIIGLIGSLGVFYFLHWKEQFPNYLMFQSSYMFTNNFYSVQLTCFATNLWFADYHMGATQPLDICAKWRILTLEENYQGKWNLECFDNRKVVSENETVSIVETWSHLYTYKIHKRWTFYREEPYFTVTIKRTYLFDSESSNNQVIVDVENSGIHTDNKTWVAYETRVGAFGYVILDAQPSNVSIQSGHPTETQINFWGAGDSDVRFHKAGEQERLTVLVYANSYGGWQDIYDFL